MRLHLIFFVFLELTVLLCTSFKTDIFRRFLSSGSKVTRTISMVHQARACNLAPDTGNELDYAKTSRRASAFFVDYDEESRKSYVNVTLISKSDFNTWNSALSNATREFLTSIGETMKKYPGSRSISVVGNLSITQMLFFYDDSEPTTKNTYKAFDGLWGGMKNKTYYFRGIDEAGEYYNLSVCLQHLIFEVIRDCSSKIRCRHIFRFCK